MNDNVCSLDMSSTNLFNYLDKLFDYLILTIKCFISALRYMYLLAFVTRILMFLLCFCTTSCFFCYVFYVVKFYKYVLKMIQVHDNVCSEDMSSTNLFK